MKNKNQEKRIIRISGYATIPSAKELQKEKVDIGCLLWRRELDEYGTKIFVLVQKDKKLQKNILSALKRIHCIACEQKPKDTVLCFIHNHSMPEEIMDRIKQELGIENVTINYD